MSQTHFKLTISNNVFEFYEFSNPITYAEPRVKKTSKTQDSEPIKKSDFNSAAYRAKKNLKRIMECNAGAWVNDNKKPYKPMFLTLTFRENIQDLNYAHNEFKKFMQRLNTLAFGTKTRDIKYVAVVEFQKRGAIHYHIGLFNLPYIDRIYDKLAEIWTAGSRTIVPIKTPRGAIKYFSKYLIKSFEDNKLKGRKKYFISTGLKKPLIVRDEESVKAIKHALENLHWLIKPYENSFTVDFVGKTDYTRYELPPEMQLKDLDLDGITKFVVNFAHLTQSKQHLWSTSHILESLPKAKKNKFNPLLLNWKSSAGLLKKADIKLQKSFEKKHRQNNQDE